MRPRIPSKLAIYLVILRSVASLASTLAFVFLLYMSITWQINFPWSYSAAALALILDTVEITALADRSGWVPRPRWAATFAAELLVLGLHVPGCLFLAIAEVTPGALQNGGDYVADPYRLYALACQGSAGVVEFLLCILGCVEQLRSYQR